MEHVLVVDDDPIYTLLASQVVKNVLPNSKVEVASNGQSAIDRLLSTENDLPDLILLDINMPIKNGWEFLDDFRAKKTKWTKVPKIVIVSSSVSSVDKQKAEQYAEVNEYITKPLQEDRFREVEEKLAK